MSKPIIIGYDGSSVSDLALEWAAQAAVDRGVPLEILLTWTVPPVNFGAGMGSTVEGEYLDEMRQASETTLQAAIEKAQGAHPGLTVAGEVMVSPPAKALVERSRTATMVVVGSHGVGGFKGLLLGSVSRQVVTHAKCPAVVIREPADPDAKGVVIGIDGSTASVKALDFAFDLASRRGMPLHVVHTWEVPPIGSMTGAPTFSPPELLMDIKGAEARTAAEVLAGHSDRYPDVKVTSEIVHGSPVNELAKASEHATLVVVGSRGRGGFTGLLLGSVSHGLVHHAKCSVAVVH